MRLSRSASLALFWNVRNEGMYLWATHRGFGAAGVFTRDTEDFDYWVYDAVVRVLVAIFLRVT